MNGPFTKDDEVLLYMIRDVVDELKTVTWAQCTTVFNSLTTHKRAAVGLQTKFKSLDKAEMEGISKQDKFKRKREEIKNLLLKQCNVS